MHATRGMHRFPTSHAPVMPGRNSGRSHGNVQWSGQAPPGIFQLNPETMNFSTSGETSKIHLFNDGRGKKYIVKEFKKRDWKNNPISSKQAEHEFDGFSKIDRASGFRLHSSIAMVHGVATVDLGDRKIKGLVMEYVPGPTIADAMKSSKLKNCSNEVKLHVIREWIFDLLSVAQSAEKAGVVHCDLKPDNMILDPKGTMKVIDWGGWAPTGRAPRTITPGFAAPETATWSQSVRQVPKSVMVEKFVPVFTRGFFNGRQKLKGFRSITVPEVQVFDETVLTPPTSSVKSDLFSIGKILQELLKSLNVRSSDANKLLFDLTQPDPARRPFIQQARNHPFFSGRNEMMARDISKNLFFGTGKPEVLDIMVVPMSPGSSRLKEKLIKILPNFEKQSPSRGAVQRLGRMPLIRMNSMDEIKLVARQKQKNNTTRDSQWFSGRLLKYLNGPETHTPDVLADISNFAHQFSVPLVDAGQMKTVYRGGSIKKEIYDAIMNRSLSDKTSGHGLLHGFYLVNGSWSDHMQSVVSVATMPKISHKFVSHPPGSYPVYITVNLNGRNGVRPPKGIVPEKNTLAAGSEWGSEHEIILDRTNKYKLIKIEYNSESHRVEALIEATGS